MNFKNKIKIIFSKNQNTTEALYGIIGIYDTEENIETLYKEKFVSLLGLWTKEDYLHQWKLAFKRLEKENSSCLIVNAQANALIELWTIHKKNNVLFVYNSLYFDETFPEIDQFWPITPENSFNFIRPHESFSKEASCWKVIL